MSGREHHYTAEVKWTGNRGTGTSGYREYGRNHTIAIEGKPELLCSSDAAFQGEVTRHNPEDFLLISLSSCHMLWYLHLCADAGIIVVEYSDQPVGIMEESPNGGGRFTSVILNPSVVITDESMIEKANALHAEANKKCFISNSVNFNVDHRASCRLVGK